MLAKPWETGLTPTRPVLGLVQRHPYPDPLDADVHGAFEVGVVLAGRMARHFESIVYTLVPGDVWLCAAWEPHGWRAVAPGTVDLVLEFLPDFLGEEMLEGVSWLNLYAAPPDLRPCVMSARTRREVMAIAEELRQEIRESRQGWPTALRLGILRLLFAVSREWKPSGAALARGAVPSSTLARIMPAVRLVHSDVTHNATVHEAAAACDMSVSQFQHTFRRAMGRSFRSFRTRTRLAYAAQLLLTTDHPVVRIAEELGFTDASHLYRAFEQAYGCTPAHYRTQGLEFLGETVMELSTEG